MDLKTQITPTVHSNGTARQDLVDQRCEAHRAGRAFLQALQDGAPHGRDFYPQGGNAYSEARKIHEARLQAIQDIMEALTNEAQAIQRVGR